VIWNEETKNAAVTDPGGDLDKIESYLETNGLKLKKIFYNTWTLGSRRRSI
jgi:hypothetical protein